jgi:hypothetical protein
VATEVKYQAFDARTGRVLGEFLSLNEAKAALDDEDDMFIMRIEEDGPPEVVWET